MKRDGNLGRIEMNFRVPMNVNEQGDLIGEKREVTHFVCPPSVMCKCQAGGSFFDLNTSDLIQTTVLA